MMARARPEDQSPFPSYNQNMHRRLGRVRLSACALLFSVCAAWPAAADSFDEMTARATARCEAIPADRGQTAMLFNPRDLQTVWERSQCFQDLAVTLRDERLCAQARERTSWMFNGSGVSPAACRRALERRRSQDRAAAGQIRGIHRVIDAAIARNGNGRDFDLQVQTIGSYAHAYDLRSLLISADKESHPIFQTTQPLGSSATKLVHLIRSDHVVVAFVGPQKDGAARLRVELRLLPSSLEERAIFALVPLSERESVLERPIVRPLESR